MKISLLDELAQAIPGLLDHWEPSEQQADYVCVFCGERAKTNRDPVVHLPDCLGQRFLDSYHK